MSESMHSRDPFSPIPNREATQLTRDDLKTMHPREIEAARKAGRLDYVMNTPDPDKANDRNPQHSRVGKGVQGKDWESIVKAGKG